MLATQSNKVIKTLVGNSHLLNDDVVKIDGVEYPKDDIIKYFKHFYTNEVNRGSYNTIGEALMRRVEHFDTLVVNIPDIESRKQMHSLINRIKNGTFIKKTKPVEPKKSLKLEEDKYKMKIKNYEKKKIEYDEYIKDIEHMKSLVEKYSGSDLLSNFTELHKSGNLYDYSDIMLEKFLVKFYYDSVLELEKPNNFYCHPEYQKTLEYCIGQKFRHSITFSDKLKDIDYSDIKMTTIPLKEWFENLDVFGYNSPLKKKMNDLFAEDFMTKYLNSDEEYEDTFAKIIGIDQEKVNEDIYNPFIQSFIYNMVSYYITSK